METQGKQKCSANNKMITGGSYYETKLYFKKAFAITNLGILHIWFSRVEVRNSMDADAKELPLSHSRPDFFEKTSF